MPIGSYTGDYVHLSDEELLVLLQNSRLKPMSPSLHDQVEADVKQVLLWRLRGDPRGWPPQPTEG
ncbi:MAG: hypothetical protein HY454_02495 [Parcubacteria group bacterium]|nr:hypothetical protein [Parcubacteria group bacterium]